MITHDNTLIDSDHIQFMRDLQIGLSKEVKQIPSKYFYDKKGSDLFNAITRHQDYYLTQCELDILIQNKKMLSDIFAGNHFNLIELGPGEGIKTKIIIDQLMKDNSSFTYIPIDISKKYLDYLSNDFLQIFPELRFHGIEADWLDGLKSNRITSSNKNIILFLGSSIGNFTPEASLQFLSNIALSLNHGGYMLIGFDLCKDTHIIHRAYDDSAGITRSFNLNLLDRINNELGGDFNLNQFEHQPRYNFAIDAMESFLVSKIKQVVNIRRMNLSFTFNENEIIHVESSYKYRPKQIEKLAQLTGFNVIKNFHDTKNYFLCSLWKVR